MSRPAVEVADILHAQGDTFSTMRGISSSLPVERTKSSVARPGPTFASASKTFR
jgi:hypothetical protein